MKHPVKQLFLPCLLFISCMAVGQYRAKEVNWTADGNGFTRIKDGNIVEEKLDTRSSIVLIKKEQLIPAGATLPLSFTIYSFSGDNAKVLIYTNAGRVWRYNTRGDYWVLDRGSSKLFQLGKGRPPQSLMFAKFSPDGKKVAYVSDHNLYVEDLASHLITALTRDGTRKFINGTFDWVYEEELDCRDGFRWSPDSRSIAFWQVDATKIRDYYMLNTTDSSYSRVVPVEYPKVGQPPSPVRIGVVNIQGGKVKWMNIPGDPQQNYLPRMQWSAKDELIVQQLNRKQNESHLYYCNTLTGIAKNFYSESDKAWIDVNVVWDELDPGGWYWIHGGKEFLWISEKDGWRHIYKISRDGKKETLVTTGNYDIGTPRGVDEKNGYVYFTASPENATQLYLYRARLDGNGAAELVSQKQLKGTHSYVISPTGKFAKHGFSNHNTPPVSEWITLPDHRPIDNSLSIENNIKTDDSKKVEYFSITTEEGIRLDGWLIPPVNFDSTKKYPVFFRVYTEPGSSTVNDTYGSQEEKNYNGSLSQAGYFQVSLDNRGTPSLRGAAWRKSIYRKIGVINISDQALGAKKFLEKPWCDKDRVAVSGWSGGGAATLNLMFQHPEIYKTGIAVAAITNELNYDNIYTERYMGLPQENLEDYVRASPITYAKNLQGNLLYMHGTGDDNVHYDNAEMLLNELIKQNKTFQFMPYPNRTHGIREGEGTRKHLMNLFTEFLNKYCPGGPR